MCSHYPFAQPARPCSTSDTGYGKPYCCPACGGALARAGAECAKNTAVLQPQPLSSLCSFVGRCTAAEPPALPTLASNSSCVYVRFLLMQLACWSKPLASLACARRHLLFVVDRSASRHSMSAKPSVFLFGPPCGVLQSGFSCVAWQLWHDSKATACCPISPRHPMVR